MRSKWNLIKLNCMALNDYFVNSRRYTHCIIIYSNTFISNQHWIDLNIRNIIVISSCWIDWKSRDWTLTFDPTIHRPIGITYASIFISWGQNIIASMNYQPHHTHGKNCNEQPQQYFQCYFVFNDISHPVKNYNWLKKTLENSLYTGNEHFKFNTVSGTYKVA